MGYKDPTKQAAYQNDWMKRRRQEWLDTNGPCAHCGSADDLRVDHVDASQKVSHRIWSWAKERREIELAKCQVLCNDCHQKKTTECGENRRGAEHPKAKLTEDDVREIRRRCESEPQTAVARAFGIDKRHVWEIVHRKTWAWL